MDVMSSVSTIWLNMVDPLLRSHRCRPPVTRRQKWKRDTSTDWATRYAIMDAATLGFMKA